jgi:hypothetical protein
LEVKVKGSSKVLLQQLLPRAAVTIEFFLAVEPFGKPVAAPPTLLLDPEMYEAT